MYRRERLPESGRGYGPAIPIGLMVNSIGVLILALVPSLDPVLSVMICAVMVAAVVGMAASIFRHRGGKSH